jgi:hypothetical protein
VEIPTVVVAASSPDLSVGEEGLRVDMDTAIGANASSLDPKESRILSKVVPTTWEVLQLREILPTASMSGYSKKLVTQKDRVMHI